MGTAHYLKIVKLQPEHSTIVFLESEKKSDKHTK